MKIIYNKKQILNILDNVFLENDELNKNLNKEEFCKMYFDKILHKLKNSSGKYSFNRKTYQDRINIYFYYTQEKNIYIILALALIEKRLFDS